MNGEFEFRGGTVVLVGAGFGGESGVPPKAAELIRAADVVLYDHLVDDAHMQLCRVDATVYFVGATDERSYTPQCEVVSQLTHYARMGLRVVRLKGRAPAELACIWSEAAALADNKIEFAVVGDASFSGAQASAH